MEKEIKNKKAINVKEVTICEATAQMILKAEKDGVETAFHRAANMKPCPVGVESSCCKHCAMGPCRLNAKDPYRTVGICGASIDTIQSRNFARMVASGAAAHCDHGLTMLELFKEVIEEKVGAYSIKDTVKLEEVAEELGIQIRDRDINQIAMELYEELKKTFVQLEGEIPFVKRVPEKTLETWRKYGIVPRGAMREIMEIAHRTHMGVDQDYENIITQISRTALADGWGGSMVATEISDILFGTPMPVRGEVNMGCLKEDYVNIIVHGHEPNLLESMVESVNDPILIKLAHDAGARGVNLVGMCCSGLEMLSRHGLPHAGNFMSTEAVLITGAVDAMSVDVQCIKQGLAKVAECYGTKLFTTNPRCRIEGVEHIEFDEKTPRLCTDTIVEMAILRFKNRKFPVEIPNIRNAGVFGFSREYINYIKQSFILDQIPRYSTTRNKRIYAAKKFYLNDNGLLFHLQGKFNQGASAERTLFKSLQEKYLEPCFYYEDKLEIDFIVKDQNKLIFFESKFNGNIVQEKIIKVAKDLGIKAGFIITKSQYKLIKANNLVIKFIPLWKWLLHS